MNAFAQLLGNEKGLVGVGLIIAATVLCAIGAMPIAMWQDFAIKIFGIYAATTAVHASAVAIASRGKTAAPGRTTTKEGRT